MYGGGNIGRGFIGALLSQSGYRVTFIDVAPPVVEHLQKNECYPIRYVFSGGYEDVLVENVTAVNGNDAEAASDAIANCDIMATAVGAGDAFCSGVLYGAWKGMDLKAAIELATASAACSLSAAGATEGMRPVAEVQKLYADMR